jgi:hypothetical protein
LLSNKIADVSLRHDSATSTMSSPAGWWSNHACCDEVSEAIVRCVDGRQSGDGATSIGDDHFFTGLDAIDVLAETILQIADPHLGPGSGYIHDFSVATLAIRSTDRFGGAAHPICQSLSDTTRFERASSRWSHSMVTPTTPSPRPNANRISVAVAHELGVPRRSFDKSSNRESPVRT